MNKLVRRICELQGIPIKTLISVICPYCGTKRAMIEVDKARWECSRCRHSGSLWELLSLVESDCLDEYKLRGLMSDKRSPMT